MNYDLKELRYLGSVWGDWVRKGCRGLGYPSETPVSKLRTSPGRGTKRQVAPDYEPCPVARRFDSAVRQVSAKHQNLIFCRFVLEMSDKRLMRYDVDFKSEGAARWAVEQAMREVGKAL